MPYPLLYPQGRRKVTIDERLAKLMFKVIDKPLTEILDDLAIDYLLSIDHDCKDGCQFCKELSECNLLEPK
jgi:hypothetical protein